MLGRILTKKKVLVYIICAICLVGAYALYIGLNPQDNTNVEQAFATEPSDVIQEEWMATEMDNISDTKCVAQKYAEQLKNQGFNTIWERQAFIDEKNAEYIDKYNEDYEILGKFISDEDSKSLKSYAETISTSLTCKAIQENECKYNEIIEKAKEEKKKEEERIAAEKAAAEKRKRYGDGSVSFNQFMSAGVVHWSGYKFTYYSQSVLPGGGLSIPGRHVEGGFVRDGDGYICVANDRPKGTVLDSPWGACKIYDRGTSGNHIDVYVR